MSTLPIISTSQNGSALPVTSRDHFDTYGNNTWHMDERRYITNTSYDIVTGAKTQRIHDVNTSLVGNVPAGWATPADGGQHLITDYTLDDEGRTTQVLGPSDTIDIGGVATTIRRSSYTVYQEATFQTWTARGYVTGTSPSYTHTIVNPVSIIITDKAGKTLEVIQALRSSTSGPLLPSDSFPQSSYVRWGTTQYSDGFNRSSIRAYKLIPASGSGTSGTHYDETVFGYDVMKRENRVVTPGGTVTRTVFSARRNAISVWVGTNDTGATDSDPSGGAAAGNNMVIVTAHQYDNGAAGGDDNLTRTTQYVDGSTARVTNFLYDWRNRRTTIDGEIDFYEKACFDNLGRVLRLERYNTALTGKLIFRFDTYYDDLSRAYRTIRYAVDPGTGNVGNSMAGNVWYDPAGRVLMELPDGAKQRFTKYAYDSLGRGIRQYMGYTQAVITYAAAQTVANDVILEQVETSYDAAGNVIQTTSRLRYHNTSGVGSLGSPSSAPPLARVTYLAVYPDALGRIQAQAEYGTNGGTALVRPATVPARSDAVLVSTTQFDSAGNTQITTDAAGSITCLSYDAAGREVQRIMNCVTGSSSSSSSSSSGGCPESAETNVTIVTSYNADGNVSQLIALNSQTGNQVTQFIYGTTLADSQMASSLLMRYQADPDSVGPSDRRAFAYNRQGQLTSMTDQLGTVHAYDYDLLGRQTQDRVTSLGPGVDSAVLRIQVSYDVRGSLEFLTSYDNATVGAGSIVNQVQRGYNAFAQLVAEYQSHSGAVNTATTPKVQYTHADGSADTIRVTSMTYPNARVVTCDYGASGGMDDAVNRIASLIDSDGASHLADYAYLGFLKIVKVNSPQPGLECTLLGTGGGNDPDTGDIYRGFDRQGRVKDLTCLGSGPSNSSSSSSSSSGAGNILERIQHAYDRAGNRRYRANLADPLQRHDELYDYDGFYRLHDLNRGTLSAARNSLLAKTFAQCWSLDETGNWNNFRQDDSGDGAWDLVQGRIANAANEITLVNNLVGPSAATPAYDAAGNMVTIPQPANPGQTFAGVFDAWNRLVQLSAGGSLLARYQYDGHNRRAVKLTYSGGVLSETRHYYFSQFWQVLEERLGSSSSPNRQYVWGLRYIDDVLLRDRDSTGGGTLNERLFGLQDTNMNLTALVNSDGGVQERYSYDAYGSPTILSPTFVPLGSSAFDWTILFSGYCWDTQSELYEVRNRVFHPWFAWLTRDPLAFLVSGDWRNQYQYVEDRPIILTDPFGLLRHVGTPVGPTPSLDGPVRVFPGAGGGRPVIEPVPRPGPVGILGALGELVLPITISVDISCAILQLTECDSDFAICMVSAGASAAACADLACRHGFQRPSGRSECAEKYLQRFQRLCRGQLARCYATCGLSRQFPRFNCLPDNPCCDLCANEEETVCWYICDDGSQFTVPSGGADCPDPIITPDRICTLLGEFLPSR